MYCQSQTPARWLAQYSQRPAGGLAVASAAGHAMRLTPYLSVEKINEIAESAQKEDVPLILSHAMTIELTVHDQSLLFVQREVLQLRVVIDRVAADGGVAIIDADGGTFTVGHGWVQGHELVGRGRG